MAGRRRPTPENLLNFPNPIAGRPFGKLGTIFMLDFPNSRREVGVGKLSMTFGVCGPANAPLRATPRQPTRPADRPARTLARPADRPARTLARPNPMLSPAMKTAILTISTSVAQGRNEDRSGEALAELAQTAGAELVARGVVADDRSAIEAWLRHQADAGAALILTTGGTGLTPDDVTPEATRAVIERDAPGFSEAMRVESLRHTPMGMLSRGVSGTVGSTLIINFPGSPKSIRELFPVIAPTLEHAVATLTRAGGRGSGHDAPGRHAGHGHEAGGGHAGD